jgi:hypothetical protein
MKAHKTSHRQSKLRSLPWEELMYVFADIPALLMAPFALFTWRIFPTVAGLRLCSDAYCNETRDKEWAVRAALSISGLCFFLDIINLVGLVLIMGTWRSYSFVVQLHGFDAAGYHSICKHDWQGWLIKQKMVTAKIWNTVMNVLLDIPFMLCGLFVTCTLFRLPILVRKLHKTLSKSNSVKFEVGTFLTFNELRKKKMKFTYFWSVRSNKNDWEWRRACAAQAGLVLLDILTCVLALVVFGSLWRAVPLYKAVRSKLSPVAKGNEAAVEPSPKKARIAVAKHFVFLMVDMIALPLFFICLFSWRTVGLVGNILASGDFYTFFAITTFTEFGRLLMDIPVTVAFIVMMILRPHDAIVWLLEDSRHKKVRKLQSKLIKQKTPILLHAIKQCAADTQDFVAVLMKEGVVPTMNTDAPRSARADKACIPRVASALAAINAAGVKLPEPIEERTKALLSRVHEEALDARTYSPEYAHLLEGLFHFEAQRPRLLMRRYYAEFVYMVRPCPVAADHNTMMLQQDEAEFTLASTKLHAALTAFALPPTPLWTASSGFWTRSRGANQHVVRTLITSCYCVEFLLFVMNLLVLHRLPHLIYRLCSPTAAKQVGDFRPVRQVLSNNMREAGRDAAALFFAIVVCFDPIRALAMWKDVVVDLRDRGSVVEARATVWAYLRLMGKDVQWLLGRPFKKITYTFTVVSLAWGLIVPLELFQLVSNLAVGSVLTLGMSVIPFARCLFSTRGYSLEDVIGSHTCSLEALASV